eukprot:3441531-Prymnesium_polylepis.1
MSSRLSKKSPRPSASSSLIAKLGGHHADATHTDCERKHQAERIPQRILRHARTRQRIVVRLYGSTPP